MALLKFLAVLVAVVAVMIGYTIVSVRIPDDMSYKTQGRLITGMGKVVGHVVNFASKLGTDKLSLIRKFIRFELGLSKKDHPNVKIESAMFDGVSVRIIDPVGRKPGGPAVMYFHGGGWVWLEPESYYNPNAMTAEMTKFLVVSVEYRLAPEHRYPAALVDCEKATQYLINNAQRYKIDPKRVAVMGDSAGGNLAAAVSLSMRNKKSPIQPKIQVLIYPVLQGLDFNLPSYQNDTKVILTREDMNFFVLAYLLGKKMEHVDSEIINLGLSNRLYSKSVWDQHGHTVAHSKLPKEHFHKEYKQVPVPEDNVGFSEELDKLVVDPLFSPLMSQDLSNLPETVILTCHYDVLRDESFLYASRLKQAAVKVTHHHDMYCYHGSITIVDRHPQMVKANQYLLDHL